MNCIELIYITKSIRSVITDKDTGKCKYYTLFVPGTYDFLGMNFYTSNLVSSIDNIHQSYYGDQDVNSTKDPSWLG